MLNGAKFIEPLVILLVLFSPLFYAGTPILALSVIEGVSFLLLAILLIRKLLEKELSFVKIPFLPVALFIAVILLQIIPLPAGIVSFLSPSAGRLYADFRPASSVLSSISIYPQISVGIVLQFLSFLGIFLVVLECADTKKRIKRIIFAVIAAGLGYSLFGIMHSLNRPVSQFSTFINSNHFANYVLMIIPLTIGLSLTDMPRYARITVIFIAAIQALALLLSLSRAGIIVFSLSFILMFLLLSLKKNIKKEWVIIFVLGFFLILFLGIIGFRPVIAELKTIIGHRSLERLHIFKDTLRIIGDFPLFGTGLGTFGEIFGKYKTFASQSHYSFAHSEPLQLLAETGMAGFVSLTIFFFMYFKEVFRGWLKRHNRFALFAGSGIFIGVFSAALHSCLDFPFHTPANALLFFVMLALLYRAVYIEGSHGALVVNKYKVSFAQPLRIIFIFGILACFVLCELLILRRYKAEAVFNSVEEYRLSGKGIEGALEYRRAIKTIDKAIALNSLNSAYFGKKADLLADLAFNQVLNRSLSSMPELAYGNTAELLSLAQAGYKEALALNPANADYHLRLGWIYGEQGNRALMQEEFKRAILLDPRNDKINEFINKYTMGLSLKSYQRKAYDNE